MSVQACVQELFQVFSDAVRLFDKGRAAGSLLTLLAFSLTQTFSKCERALPE
jgi:hypothetical protein